MAKRFPPRADKDAVDCLQAFADGIAADCGKYGISPGESETISRVVAEFAQAYRVAANESTRSQVDVAAKDQARWSAQKLCQLFARQISGNLGISDGAKRAINVNPLNNTRTRIYVQKSSPTLTIVAATPGAHTLRSADSLAPHRAAMAPGATNLQVFVAIGDAPATDPAAAHLVGCFTRNQFAVTFKPEDRGRTATYFARWAGRRGNDVGMWSLPVSMTIAA